MNASAPTGQAHFLEGAQLASHGRYVEARDALRQAATAGHAAALGHLAILRHHGLGEAADPPAAMAMYAQAADAGDAESAVRLAIAHLHGRWLPCATASIAKRIVQASLWQHRQALELLRLLAQSTRNASDSEWLHHISRGASPDRGRLHAMLLAHMDQDLPQVNLLHAAPMVAQADEVLTPAECVYLIQLARPGLAPARVINPHTRELVQDPARNNQSAPLGTRKPDLCLAMIEWRMARLTHLPLAHAEYAAALRYRPGEEYRPHRDYLLPQTHPEQFAANGAGQRIRTSCTYLNSVAAGGQTHFPQLGVLIQPVAGRMVIFDNVDEHGQPEPRSLHAGLPVTAGEKWLATLWYRQRALRSA